MNNSNKKSAILNAILLAVLYTAIIGVGMYLSFAKGYRYGDPRFVRVLVWVEMVLVALSVFWAKRFWSWPELGCGRGRRRELLWMLPPFALLFAGWAKLIANFQMPAGYPWLFPLIGLTTLMVGFSEELVYRGVVLNAFRKLGSVLLAMLASAVAFSLLHSVNYFGGLPANAVVAQLKATFIFGLFFAPLAVRIRALWPLVIFHWLYDFLLIGGIATVSGPPVFFSKYFQPLEYAMIVLLWASIWFFPPAKNEPSN